MAIKSVIKGWECEGCGINRNTMQETHRDCICGIKEKDENFYNEMKELVPVINEVYWKSFWNKNK